MKEEKKFQTESKELLNLMINSIYSNQEIFLRELISNASDAIDKYKFEAYSSNGTLPQKDYRIDIRINKEQKYIEIEDDGIGMSKDDLEKNLGTIARSGSKEFLEKLKEAKDKKEEDIDIIGQFGVGFYSAFMVGKKVEVYTKDLKGESYLFSSDGVDTYTIEDIDWKEKKDSGSLVRVYLKDDTDDVKYSEYLDEYKIRELVKKYSDFIRYPIRMDVHSSEPELDKDGKPIEGKYKDVVKNEVLNSMVPLWKKAKKDVTDKDLNEFYKTRFNDYEDPLVSLFIKAEGMMEYEAVIFIPAHAPYNLYSENYEKGLQLYAKGVFIEDKNKALVPDYLKFIRGLVDSDDLNLNISREMLQKTPLLDKIANNIEKKIVEKLKDIKKNDPEKYEKFFNVYGDFIKFGIYSSYGVKKDSLQDLLIYPSLNSGDKKISLEDYVSKMKEGQKNIYFASGRTLEMIRMLPELEKYRKEGTDVLLCASSLDEFTFSMMNSYKDKPFKNITTESKDEQNEEEKKKLEQLSTDYRRFLDDVKSSLKGKVDDVVFSNKLVDAPVCLSSKEGISMNMANVINEENPQVRNGEQQALKAQKVLEINPDHPLFNAVKNITDEKEVSKISSVLYDEAMMLEGFEVENKKEFIDSLNDILLKAYVK